MKTTVSSKPLIKAGWLRALLYVVVVSIAAVSLLVGFIAGVTRGRRDRLDLKEFMKGDNPSLMILMFFVMTLIITYSFRRWIDRKSFSSLGLEIKGHGREAIAGASLAIFIIGCSCLINQITGHLKWMDILFDPKSVFMALGAVVLSAFYEELIFRGYLLSNLLESFPKWLALVISTLLFTGFHWNSNGLFPMLNMLIMGFIAGLFYLYTRNLWFPFFFHAAWKFMAGPVLGFSNDPASQSLLQMTVQGDENITGGASGLEGSVMLTAVSLLSALVLFLILEKKNQSKISTSSRSNIRSFPARG